MNKELDEAENATEKKSRGRKPPEAKQDTQANDGSILSEQGEQVTVSVPERDESGEMVFIDDRLQRRHTTVSKELAEQEIQKWDDFEKAFKKDQNTRVAKGNPHWRGARIEK